MSDFDTKKTMDRFEISVPPLNTLELTLEWELYREAHNGFDNYLAFKVLSLQAQLEKAERVIGFYADRRSWTGRGSGELPCKMNVDQEIVTRGKSIWHGGKLAREYQAKKERG